MATLESEVANSRSDARVEQRMSQQDDERPEAFMMPGSWNLNQKKGGIEPPENQELRKNRELNQYLSQKGRGRMGSISTTTSLNGDDQAKDKDEQINVGEIHP
jgi:hypothetical protein